MIFNPDKKPLLRAFERLAFFDDDLYLAMQIQNIALVDDYLVELETDLLSGLISEERTPVLRSMFVSAVSQMWVFAVYELLRTWRQRAREVLKFGEELHSIEPWRRRQIVERKVSQIEGSSDGAALLMRRNAFKRVATKRFYEKLKESNARIEAIYSQIEELRVTLAKHEIPKKRGHTAYAPGYARISSETGSIYWCIELKDKTMAILSRRGISDSLKQVWAKR